VKVSAQRLELRLAHPWTIARTHAAGTSAVVIVELFGTDGVTGIGEAAPIARYDESAEAVEEFCHRVDPGRLSFEDVAGSLDYLNSFAPGNASAKCAIDVALHDGAAKLARKRLHDFIGLGFKDRKHSTSFSIGIDRPEATRRKVLEAAEFPVLKMKMGSSFDKENLRILREVAPDKPLRIDANEAWAVKEKALEMIEWLARDGNIQFIEQPMPASTPEAAWIWLKQRSPLTLFADESYHSAGDAARAASCFHGVNVKLTKAGGIRAAIAALRAARQAGLRTMLGCMIETSVLISAAAHLAELADYLDLDGNLLITNDPYLGVTAEKGMLSFANAPEPFGLRINSRR
jgi:L-alanine-DL-glutamate epimerase-like enolase superfamily enzyme